MHMLSVYVYKQPNTHMYIYVYTYVYVYVYNSVYTYVYIYREIRRISLRYTQPLLVTLHDDARNARGWCNRFFRTTTFQVQNKTTAWLDSVISHFPTPCSTQHTHKQNKHEGKRHKASDIPKLFKKEEANQQGKRRSARGRLRGSVATDVLLGLVERK